LFNPLTSTFHQTADMCTTRAGHSAILLPDGKVLLIGGLAVPRNIQEAFQNGSQSFLEVYDPVTQIFSSLLWNMFWTGFSAALLNDGNILLAGGQGPGGVLNGGMLLDPRSGQLTVTGSLGFARTEHTATLLNDGRVLVVGGETIGGPSLTLAEIYSNAA